MKKILILVLFLLLITFFLSSNQKSNVKLVECNWATGKFSEIGKINSETFLTLHINNFNFFHYSLNYEVNEKKVEAYSSLEKLWKEIFGLLPITISSKEQKTITDWAKSIMQTDEILGCYNSLVYSSLANEKNKSIIDLGASPVKFKIAMNNYLNFLEQNKSSIKNNEKTNKALIIKMRNIIITKKSNLNRLKFIAFKMVSSQQGLKYFNEVENLYKITLSKINLFLQSASDTLNGRIINIGKKNSGSYVLIKLIPSGLILNEIKRSKSIRSIEYFVHSFIRGIFESFTHHALSLQ